MCKFWFQDFCEGQVSAKFFTLKDRIDNNTLLQRPLNFRPTLVSCKLGVGEGCSRERGAGCIYIVLKHGNKGLYFQVPMPI